MGYSPLTHKELDTTEQLHSLTHPSNLEQSRGKAGSAPTSKQAAVQGTKHSAVSWTVMSEGTRTGPSRMGESPGKEPVSSIPSTQLP